MLIHFFVSHVSILIGIGFIWVSLFLDPFLNSHWRIDVLNLWFLFLMDFERKNVTLILDKSKVKRKLSKLAQMKSKTCFEPKFILPLITYFFFPCFQFK